jgi:PAS domain S-box-containing protein
MEARHVAARRPGVVSVAAWLGGDLEESLEEIQVPACVSDRNGVIRWENKRFRELFGEARGRQIMELIPPEARQATQLERAKMLLGSKPVADFSSVRLTTGGERIPVEVHAVALRDGGRVVGTFGIAYPGRPRAAATAAGPLTPRQRQVLEELARGASTAQIAETLVLSPETVRNHVRALLRALHVHSRLEAIVEARRSGLLS